MRISDWSPDLGFSHLRSAPDLARGAKLNAENCSMCHGATGAGNGPGAAGLDPPPIAFTDAARARERSLFALYQVISQGLEGTSMASFEDLPDGDRWALSFYVGSLAFTESSQTSGGRSEEHTSELQSLMRNAYAVLCLKKKNTRIT